MIGLALVGMRWVAVVNLLCGAALIWWLNNGQTTGLDQQVLMTVYACLAGVVLMDGLTQLPVLGRFLRSREGKMGILLFSVINFVSTSLWIVIGTSFGDANWIAKSLAMLAIGSGTIALGFIPQAMISRLCAAILFVALLGQMVAMKIVLSIVCVLLAAMTLSLDRRRRTLFSRFEQEHHHAVSAQHMVEAFEQSGRGWFWQTDEDGRLTYLSEASIRKLGRAEETVIGMPFSNFVTSDSGDERMPGAADRTFGFTLAAGVDFADIMVRANVEEEIWWSLSGVSIHDSKGRCIGFRGSGVDLTDQRKTEAEARQLANYDALTGLANRAMIRKTLEDVMTPVHGVLPHCGLMLLDLDRFKNVNDTLGHPVGDELLKIVSKRLLRVVGQGCQVGRLGGDEFQVVVPEFTDRIELGRMADAIIDRLSLPYDIEGVSIRIGASVGIAVAPSDGVDADELTRNADLALYAAKGAGKGVHRFYQPDMHSEADDRRALENDLREMLVNNELSVVYQPIVDAQTERVVGFEALARWEHPERGAIPPSKFIPIAEEIGLVGRIGEWVMREACREAATWPDHLHIAINLSPKQFESVALTGTLINILADTGLAPERLELEITEGMLLSESAMAEETLGNLTSMGIKLSLDDFGTGYASLGYLRRVQFSKIKVDQSFVRGASDKSSRNSAIIRAIVSLAESLGIITVAEGVETLDEIDMIRGLGCTQIQGFIFGAPRSAEVAREQASKTIPLDRPGGPGDPMERENRISLLRVARLRSGKTVANVKIRNVSASGALLEVPGNIALGPSVEVELADGTKFSGEVRWRRAGRIGLYFPQQIDVDQVIGKPGGGQAEQRHVA
ncbi:MAG TPA: EAL domain-containing protein [Chakrabartia sp.]|nr:EAL domain-containing protein [Chakrabartia sp.]